MAKRVKKYRVGQRSTLDIVIAVILGFMTLAAVFPFYQVVLLSFADMASYAKHPLYLLPYCFDLTGYKTIFEDPMFFTSLGVTLFITLVGTSLNMFLSVMGAYVLSRKYLMGRKVILNLIIFTMLFNGGLIPTYLVYVRLGLINTRLAVLLSTAFNVFNMVILRTSFQGIPEALEESARLDGANDLVILTRIILPLSKASVAVITLFVAVTIWNSWFTSAIYQMDRNMWPIQMFLREVLINNSQKSLEAGAKASAMELQILVKYAIIIVATLPILCIYPFVQKYFVKGVLIGSVKG